MPTSSEVNLETIYNAASIGNIELVEKILGEGDIDISVPDSRKRIALHYALMFSVDTDPSVKNQKISVANLLIDSAPETLAYQDEAGNTAVHFMSVADLDTLLAKAITIDKRLVFTGNHHGAYPIHVAIANQSHKVIAILLDVDSMPGLVDDQERSLIHHAAEMNNIDVLQCLFNHHNDSAPDINLLDEDGETALDIANRNGYPDVIKLLQQHGAKTHEQLSKNNLK